MLAADVLHGAVAAQAGQHDLDLLLRRPAAVLALLAQPWLSLSVERPILSRTPDSPSGATRLQDCPALQPNYLSTRDRGAGQPCQAGVGARVLAEEKPHPVAAWAELAAFAGPALRLLDCLAEAFRARRAKLNRQDPLHQTSLTRRASTRYRREPLLPNLCPREPT
jgi:hypothetical protein